MSSIKKTVLSGGREHYIQVDSSLDLEEVEITGSDPVSGKTVHISLSSLLKQPSKPQGGDSPAPMDMFSGNDSAESPPPGSNPEPREDGKSEQSSDNVINDLFK